MTYEEASDEIRRLSRAKGLPSVQEQVLEVTALDDYGFQLSAAPSILAVSTNRSTEECLEGHCQVEGKPLT